ncbi:TonB-dependent receptor plug domain-containing protein [Tenacibaculum singaporense]|uniref:TonB-dependent receptor plug domain-containing protein n=1 Tax=Tenacibaculum singaporense TaxID=2358479 RepID=UPI000F67BE49|nr:TonB-dependent receptor [Tenacibaculum singaporense]RSC93978.1 TonB-dependent receptor [Tenacibaculum singaporense]
MFLNKEVLLSFMLMSFVTFSQENTSIEEDATSSYDLDEVIVTATRTSRQLSSIPMPVTLITKEQLQKSGSVRLRDILLEQTGITIVSDFGNSEGVQLQGVAADYTLILLDGVPIVGRTSGNIDLNRLTVNNIKQIEIVKGPSSSLYGSEAIGGVINIITEKPKYEQFKGTLSYFVRDGAKNELDINTNVVWKKKKLGVVAGVNLNSSEGFDLSPETASKTTAPHQNFTGNLKVMYDFSDKLQGTISQRYFSQKQGDDSEENKQEDWNVTTKLSHEITNKWDVDYTFYATKYNAESIFNNEKTNYNQTLLRPEIKSKNTFSTGTLILGAGANLESLERTEFEGVKKFNTPYVFSQFDFNPINNLNVIVGARFEDSNQYKSAFTPKISSSYKINDWLMAKGSVGYGFKAPDFRQLYFNFKNTASGYIVLGTQTLHDLYGELSTVQAIEKELKPESSIGYNFGFQVQPISNLKLNINLFRNDIKDLIDTFDTQLQAPELNLPAGTRTFSYRNIDEVYTQGIEVDANYKINNNFRILGGYQFLDTGDKNQEEKIKSGTIFFRKTPVSPAQRMTLSNCYGLPNRSKHMGNLKLFYENFQYDFSANIRAVYRSKYALFDTNDSQGIIDEFDDFVSANTQVNMAVDKTLFKLMNVQIGVDNLFDERGIENKQSFTNNDSVLRLGRTYYGRIQFNF